MKSVPGQAESGHQMRHDVKGANTAEMIDPLLKLGIIPKSQHN